MVRYSGTISMDEKLGSLDLAEVLLPGGLFSCRRRLQGAVGVCIAVEEGPPRRILILWSSPEKLSWIKLPIRMKDFPKPSGGR